MRIKPHTLQSAFPFVLTHSETIDVLVGNMLVVSSQLTFFITTDTGLISHIDERMDVAEAMATLFPNGDDVSFVLSQAQLSLDAKRQRAKEVEDAKRREELANQALEEAKRLDEQRKREARQKQQIEALNANAEECQEEAEDEYGDDGFENYDEDFEQEEVSQPKSTPLGAVGAKASSKKKSGSSSVVSDEAELKRIQQAMQAETKGLQAASSRPPSSSGSIGQGSLPSSRGEERPGGTKPQTSIASSIAGLKQSLDPRAKRAKEILERRKFEVEKFTLFQQNPVSEQDKVMHRLRRGLSMIQSADPLVDGLAVCTPAYSTCGMNYRAAEHHTSAIVALEPISCSKSGSSGGTFQFGSMDDRGILIIWSLIEFDTGDEALVSDNLYHTNVSLCLTIWEEVPFGVSVCALVWSPSRPAVFYASFSDNSVLVWDLLECTNGPTLSYELDALKDASPVDLASSLYPFVLSSEKMRTSWPSVAWRTDPAVSPFQFAIYELGPEFTARAATEQQAVKKVLTSIL
ncbi:hypothetical protein JM16_005618 [Phytophthora kernoviae]|uniref:Uncharacterized protein n=1 Tax=Phytophthora kernoviae TaxID=325452 RepID=A0A8T0LVB9_9STRA|nr:hypothetical protein JM16_005618 [Phytophthora kernoviae]